MIASRLFTAGHWIGTHPIALINIIVALILLVIFADLVTRPIDVLDNWSVKTTRQTYAPGGTLEFVSTSTKLVSAEGQTSRLFDCDATGSQQAREIMLPQIAANRAPGYNPPKENSITVPGVTAFNGLPRTCRIVFNVCYQNVILWRDHCESARTNDFYVREDELDATGIRQQIEELNERIRQLEGQLQAYESTRSLPNTTIVRQAPGQVAVNVSPQPQAPSSPSPSPSPSVSPTPAPADPRCAIGLLGLCILGSQR